MKQNILLLCIALFLCISCEKKEIDKFDISTTRSMKVLNKRDRSKPIILSNKSTTRNNISKNTSFTTSPLNLKQYLGRSYETTNVLLGDSEGVKYPVINIEKIEEKYPDYILHTFVGKNASNYFSYATFDRYEETSKYSKTKNSGFKFKLGPIGGGANKTVTEIFSDKVTNDKKSIYGELNISVIDASYTIFTTTNALNKIAWECLNERFLDELYNISIGEFITTYGNVVLMDYYTGGKATALYAGQYNKDTTFEEKEKVMNKNINASVNYKDNNGSIDLAFGNSNGGSSSSENDITNLSISIKTIGGSGNFSNFSMPKSIDEININLSPWANSLVDKSTHNLIEIKDEGLLPISALLLEKNFQYCFNEYRAFPMDLQEPALYIAGLIGPIGNYISVFLYTRNANLVYLHDPEFTLVLEDEWWFYENDDEFYEKANILSNRYKDIYKLDILAIPDFSSNDCNPADIIFCDMDETKMKKFKHPHYNITYLLYTEGDKKYGYAIHDDYILDTYGIRDLYNTLPEITISQTELKKYTIVGL